MGGNCAVRKGAAPVGAYRRTGAVAAGDFVTGVLFVATVRRGAGAEGAVRIPRLEVVGGAASKTEKIRTEMPIMNRFLGMRGVHSAKPPAS